MQIYSKVLLDAIEREKAGIDYFCKENDKETLHMLLEEVNRCAGTTFQYLAELDAFVIPNAGGIFADYIRQFSAQSVRGYLLHQIVSGHVKDCEYLVMELYKDFKMSGEYIPSPGIPASAHIYTRYDSALKTLKPKRLRDDLIQLAYCPRDFFYLPFTMKMLASWGGSEIKDLLVKYSSKTNISELEVGIRDNGELYFPPFSYIKREIRFTAIE